MRMSIRMHVYKCQSKRSLRTSWHDRFKIHNSKTQFTINKSLTSDIESREKQAFHHSWMLWRMEDKIKAGASELGHVY